jgi:hypothetical protein
MDFYFSAALFYVVIALLGGMSAHAFIAGLKG